MSPSCLLEFGMGISSYGIIIDNSVYMPFYLKPCIFSGPQLLHVTVVPCKLIIYFIKIYLNLCILKGRSLKDPNEELVEAGLKNGSKVMLIGKRVCVFTILFHLQIHHM